MPRYGFSSNYLCETVRKNVAIVQDLSMAEVLFDPLSDVLELLRPQDCVAAGLDAGGNWSIGYAPHAGLKCNAVMKGGCWLTLEGAGSRIWLGEGDCVMLPHGKGFVLSARGARQGEPAEAVHSTPSHGATATLRGGGDFFMTGARFLLSGLASDILLASLPDVVVIRSGADDRSASGETVRWAVTRITAELRSRRPGSARSIEHLSHILLIELMRCHLEEGQEGHFGWTAALSDPYIRRALAAMQGDLARSWTVASLAEEAGLSRTAFAVRFARLVGQTPMGYLTLWRMLWAAQRIDRAGLTIAVAAAEVGYASESAFTAAFKRTLGQTPRRFVSRQSKPLPVTSA
ncbi:AraC family transcriptional regulator [Oceanicella sp. SM1341]|uniref:AraC family transcriptional regulator n=1 Tax=Oceanicella sp. SM1341 TaxID=1548889 RepID=UPI001E58C436|nr:AraC family transcriptional regulator [Oceanicella sp. SM1341]